MQDIALIEESDGESLTVLITNNFNDRLLSLIENEGEKELIKSQYGIIKNIDFIELLARQFREEWAIRLKLNPEEDKCEQVKKIGDYALDSIDNCLNYAYFIYFADIISNCKHFEWISAHLKISSEIYPDSGFLKFLYGYAVSAEVAQAEAVPSFSGIKDPVELIADSSHSGMDPESVIKAQKKFLSVLTNNRKEHRELFKYEYKLLYDETFNESTLNSYINAKISNIQTVLAIYYWLRDKKEEAKELLDEALELYRNNPYAIAQQGYLMVDENPSEAIDKFKKALKLVKSDKDQFSSKLQKTYAEIGGNSGWGLSYYEQGFYEKAEVKHNKALDIQKQRLEISKLIEVILRLDIDRSRIERGDFTNAMEDLRGIKKELTAELKKYTRNERLSLRDKLVEVHNLLGLIYLRQGIYEYAEPFFLEAIKLNPKLAQSYHNFGTLQYEKGDKERAKKLFKASVSINPNYKNSIEALKKLEESEIVGISDWYKWWFEDEESHKKMGFLDPIERFLLSPKKIIGGSLVVLLIFLIIFASYSIVTGIFSSKNLGTSLFGAIAIIIVVLMLPFLKKVEAGSVTFEIASKGEQPRF